MRTLSICLALVAGLGFVGKSLLRTESAKEQIQVPKHMFVALDLSSPEERDYAKWLLDGISRKVKRYEQLTINQLSGGQSQSLYSNVAKRQAIESIIEDDIVAKPASDAALVAALQQIRQYGQDLRPGQHLVAIISTSGTSDKGALSELATICKYISRKGDVTVYLVGVLGENRQALAPIFHPIRANAQVLGVSESEREELMKKL